VTGYESLIPALQLSDSNDRHVLAAAISGGADTIVTFNLKDFPQDILDGYDIIAQHPDDFIADLIDWKPQVVMAAVETCRKRLRNPPKSIGEYVNILLKQGLSISTSLLKEFYDKD
jgi:hypothetical protein